MIEAGVDDTLCRKRGLTIYGTGMHHDPLISSRKRVHVSWGHDWVIRALLVPNPPWSPTKGLRISLGRLGAVGRNSPLLLCSPAGWESDASCTIDRQDNPTASGTSAP